jgi:anaerobic magnesium-protoporphyrin IX monomethyl ester cyclase
VKTFLFINLAIDSGWNTGINHGIAYLVPVVRKSGLNVSCLNLQQEISGEAFISEIKKANPDIVGFSSTSQQLKYLIHFSKIIRDNFSVIQLCGGVGPTLDPLGFLEKTNIDAVCIGEGENSLSEFLQKFMKGEDLQNAAGFYWKTPEEIIQNKAGDYINELLEDFPDYSVFDKKLVCNNNTLWLLISRGCPYSCTYCCNHALKGIYPAGKSYFRRPTIGRTIAFIKKMIADYPGITTIEFEDDLLPADKQWFTEFTNEYGEQIGLPYRICSRPESISEEIVASLSQSGCRSVYIGLESGNEAFRKKMLKRNYSNAVFIEKCRMIKKAGIELYTFSIVGFPFETKKELKDTLKLNMKVRADKGDCFFFYPYYGTELYKICKENGLLPDESELLEVSNYSKQVAIKMSGKHKQDCVFYRQEIYNYFSRDKIKHYRLRVFLLQIPFLYRGLKTLRRSATLL